MPDLILQNTAEGGTDGTTVTTANSGAGSGDAFATVQGTWTYEADAARGGTLGFRLTTDATARYLRGDDPSPDGRGGASGWFYYPGTAPTASYAIYGARTAADAQLGSLNVYTDGKVYLYTRTGARVTAAGTTTALTEGWHRFMFLLTPGASTTTARVEVKVWDAAATVLLDHDTGTTWDAGVTDPVARNRFGGMTSSSGLASFDVDNLRWGHVASGDIPDVANVPPEVSPIPVQNVTPGSTVTVTVTAADPDGTVAAHASSVVAARSTSTPTLTGATTPEFTFTAPTAGNLVTLQSVVTDNLGATTTVTTEVRVPLSGASTTVPLAIDGTNVVGTMTRVGAATTDGAALADALDTTYIESGTLSATEQSERYRMQPQGLSSSRTITVRLSTDSGTANAVVRLYEGSTVRQTWTQTGVSTTPTDYTLALSSGTIAAIGDWSDLAVEVGGTA